MIEFIHIIKGRAVLDTYGIFPYDTPDERKWWLLGVCCSKVTYIKQKRQGIVVYYPKLTSISEIEFVEQVRAAFGINLPIHEIPPPKPGYNTQYFFHFPQSERDYFKFFTSEGVLPGKSNRRMPPCGGDSERHFMRGYFEAQISPFFSKRHRSEISIHFASTQLGKQFTNALLSYGMGQGVTLLEPEGDSPYGGQKVTSPFELYKVKGANSWEIKIRGRLISDLCDLLYSGFEYPITYRNSVYQQLSRVMLNWLLGALGEPTLPNPDGSPKLPSK